ncbi:MAG: UDP-N-acetylmuramoyl-L-alanine--D-glutamate ligase [Patescibacteria group bacterium]|nr:UDP-N-acetylmuramoyl-L-alanine--D-glutamate ligase [Patescibacteria group bacterium]
MLKAQSFEFVSYSFVPKQKKVSFKYKISFIKGKPLFFVENIVLPKTPGLSRVPKDLLDNLLQGLHLILGVSYYKIYCPAKIKLNKPLSPEQADFWDKVYKRGLGEFFYRNKLNPKIVKFPFKKIPKAQSHELKRKNRSLLGIGGGKDSIVAAELLKKGNFEVNGFAVETEKGSEVIDSVIKKSGLGALKIRRILDPKLFSNLPNSYNGHVPISAVYGFLGVFCAVLYDYSNVIVANEQSSNFGNLVYYGEIINHQWSKSQEFEELFQNYVNNFITPDIKYFSLLRPFYEIRIARMFSEHKKYFPYFSSCNQNFRANRQRGGPLWCGKCPKCVFAFTLLSAFISKKELLGVFKKNLYEDESLLRLFSDLLGFGKMKPFDCVGAFEETRAALYLARNKFKNSFIIAKLLSKIQNPDDIAKKVFSTNLALNIPTRFRFLGMKSILILGFGKEGQTTRQYLQKNFPKCKIGIADQKQDGNYLEKQKKYDIVVKTPGIARKNIVIQYTTASNIFLSQIDNMVIGVSGSKGKSTTASLIYEILKTAGKKVCLLGNIGQPMLKSLLGPIEKSEIFVLELSSYQLDDIEFSPNVAVITNLFPEHMDYHGGVKPYFEAKQNIVKYQRKNDFFIYNPKVGKLGKWAKETKAKTIPFEKKIPLNQAEIPLLGEHNKDNIKAAVSVAKIFKIKNEIIKKAIGNFKPLPHRLELVGEFSGIKFYDDAISTAPESTIMALKSIPNIKTIFLGGEDRGYDFFELEKIIRKNKIENIVLFPKSGKRMFKQRRGLNILETSIMKKAVEFAYKNTPQGTACLLSTASPSYTIWKNFEEKGDQFKYWVKKFSKKYGARAK